MPTLVGGLAALIALAAGILFRVEPVASIQRSVLAFLLGWILTQIWYVFFTVRIGVATADSGEAHSEREEQRRAA